MQLKIKRLTDTAIAPSYAHEGDAGMDLCADMDVVLYSGKSALVKTGIAIAVPVGHEAQVRPRSGLALKRQITVLNTPGTIDSGFRGEVGVILINHGKEVVSIKKGDRIAQLVITPVIRAEIEEVQELAASVRGEGGFGSTGI